MKLPGLIIEAKKRLSIFLSQRKNLTFLMIVGGAFLVMAAVILAFVFRPDKKITELIVEPTTETVLRHPLTGERLESPLSVLPQVFGVMVENSADAWPLSGLDKAFLVIEAPVEGNIPRFIAFFSADTEIKKLGPVRSARPYYLDWASQFDNLIYAHVGGSPAALERLHSGELPLLDLNEFFQGEHFYRDQRRYAPHNVYTNSQLMSNALAELQPAEPHYAPLVFKDDSPVESLAQVSFSLDWGPGSTYDVNWEYQAATNSYVRFQSGDELAINANNVIVLATDVESIDNVDRKQVATIGQGDAMLFQDGQVTVGRWIKTSSTEPLRIVDEQGDELPWNAGRTWIEVVRSLTAVSLESSGESTD